jgi:hypothetical protein
MPTPEWSRRLVMVRQQLRQLELTMTAIRLLVHQKPSRLLEELPIKRLMQVMMLPLPLMGPMILHQRSVIWMI